MAAVAAPPRIHGTGTPAQAWAAWPGWSRVAGIGADSLVAPQQRAVVIAPHPDDEVIGAGLLLQGLRAAGREVLVVAVTDGEASHPGSALWPPTRLGAGRRSESLAALRCLVQPQPGQGAEQTDDAEQGESAVEPDTARAPTFTPTPESASVPPLVRLGLPDGGLRPRTVQLAQALADVAGPHDVLFATWRHDGHPDHEAVGLAALAAASLRGCRCVEMPVWCWHWAAPGDPRIPWTRARRLHSSALQRQRKQQAIACFDSQRLPDPSTGAGPILPATALDRWAGIGEVFFV